jgi:hypothetical protein
LSSFSSARLLQTCTSEHFEREYVINEVIKYFADSNVIGITKTILIDKDLNQFKVLKQHFRIQHYSFVGFTQRKYSTKNSQKLNTNTKLFRLMVSDTVESFNHQHSDLNEQISA